MISWDNDDGNADEGAGRDGRAWALHIPIMDVLVTADLRMCTHHSHERGSRSGWVAIDSPSYGSPEISRGAGVLVAVPMKNLRDGPGYTNR